MFRLIKLAVLGLLGYAIYEFVRGMSGVQIAQKAAGAMGQGKKAGSGPQQTPPHLGSGNMQFSGPGEGQHIETEDAAGTSTPHFVGRGVVRR